ncbi:hypothetical protein ACFPZ0_11315 [Streptomonospora nanhaiensis]|uniref:Biotin operon repressor n=1 Tax=Streptomonospora nanhaiensis TaxID=1323731 RepID=A0A853BUY0_9ACTN|nr:helix-turn-helix domain-containing protein [Streptomonospora nanhaiensis]MBV2366000.1 hypothetical protein [Streptomonospora nanhaiensis]MBX9388819.1 hypothetical protein [Streptomonospora nanhaiensis]NYI98317.1 biotin operon repressor [Streptomonospora nanhaiensis]
MSSTAVRADITAHLRTITAPASAAEIATALGKARSTVTAALRDLEQAGHAVRTPGGRDSGRRQPDLWTAAPADAPAEAPEQPRTDEESFRSAEGEATDASGSAPAGAVDHPPAAPGRHSDTGPGDGAEAASVQHPAVAPGVASTPKTANETVPAPEAPVAINPVTKTARLEPGALRLMVHAILRDSPQEEFSPTEISHLLRGRSVGAIQNALARLVNDGQAVLTCEAPRRYSAA